MTGGGGAACRRFAAEGAKVAVFDMNVEAARRVADEIKAAGGIAQAFKCDITERSAPKSMPPWPPPKRRWAPSPCW